MSRSVVLLFQTFVNMTSAVSRLIPCASFLLILQLVSLPSISSSKEFSYVIVTPRVLHHGKTEHFLVHVSRFPLKLVVNGSHSGLPPFLHTYPITARGSSVPFKLSTNFTQKVTLSLTLQECTNEKHCKTLASRNATLAITKNRLITFIETSKPIYKPGEKVQFRVLGVESTALKPMKETIFEEIYIESPDQRKMAQWTSVDWERAFRGLEILLSRDPTFGDWNIVARTSSVSFKEKFTVKKYVLPKFSVTIKPPKVLLYSDVQLTVNVCAKYSTGKPMKGTVTTRACFKEGPLEIPCFENASSLNGKADCVTVGFHTDFFTKSASFRFGNTYQVWVTSSVIEDGTGEMVEEKLKVGTLHYSPVHLAINSPKSFKNGMPFYADVVATYHDGSPFTGAKISCTGHGLESWAGYNQEFSSGSDGIVQLTVFPVPRVPFTLTCRTDGFYLDSSKLPNARVDTYVQVTKSVHGGYIQIFPPTRKVFSFHRLCEGDLQLNLESNFDLSKEEIYVQMVSRGSLEVPQIFQPAPWSNHSSFPSIYTRIISVPLHQKRFIDLHVVVYVIRDDKSVMADSVEIKMFQECLLMSTTAKTTFQFTKSEIGPGKTVKALLKYQGKDAKCSLKISDVNLLHFGTSGNVVASQLIENVTSINHDYLNFYADSATDPFTKIMEDICKLKIRKLSESFQQDMVNVFIKEGLLVFTDEMLIDNSSCIPYYYYHGENSVFAKAESADQRMNSVPEKNNEASLRESVRDYFPETWKFQFLEDPGTQLSMTTPDSMTSWNANFYCVTDEGLGIAPPATLTVLSDFFVQLTLPYSIIRDEIAEIPVTVFNYLPHCYEVGLSVIPGAGLITLSHTAVKMCICDFEQKTVHFRVQALELGMKELLVTASSSSTPLCYNKGRNFTGNVKDSVKRNIRVEPEGIPQESNVGELICLNKERRVFNLTSRTPLRIVPDSARGYVIWTADIMGQSLANLDSLVRMPFGCGEQNMITMVPSIHVLDYFSSMGILMPDLERKARRFIDFGYTRELKYRHKDGSFSAFGPQDKDGSTWLTAFVVKSFVQAQKYIVVDKQILLSAVTFLIKQQDKVGCFFESGHVIHQNMKGVSGKDSATLTAYVLTAIVETDSSLFHNRDDVINRAVSCIQTYTPKNLKSIGVGAVALRTYALSLLHVNDTLFRSYYNTLVGLAEQENGLIFWPDKTKQNSKPQFGRHGGTSVAVEATGYGLLSVMNDWSILKSLKIVRWMTKNRNALGGWYSTQDTVVGLHSLSSFAKKLTFYNGSSMTLIIRDTNYFFKIEHINRTNRLRTWKMPISVPNSLQFDLSGKGCVVLLVSTLYNVPKENVGEPSFEITISDKPRNEKRRTLRGCAFYNGTDHKSNMVVLEMKMLSGWMPVESSLEALTSQIQDGGLKRVDMNEQSALEFYFDSFVRGQKTCVDVDVEEKVKVENLQKTTARVYDYYQPEFAAETMYRFTRDAPVPPPKSSGPTDRKSKVYSCYTEDNLSPLQQIQLLKAVCTQGSRLIFARKSNSNLWNFEELEPGIIKEWSSSLQSGKSFLCLKGLLVGERIVLAGSDLGSNGGAVRLSGETMVFTASIAKKYLNPSRSAVCEAQRALYMSLLRFVVEKKPTKPPVLGSIDCVFCPMQIPIFMPTVRLCKSDTPLLVASNFTSESKNWTLKLHINAPGKVKAQINVVGDCQCPLHLMSSNYQKPIIIFARSALNLIPRNGTLQLDYTFLVTSYESYRTFCGIK